MKQLYASSISKSLRTPRTKFETYNPIDVGGDTFQVKTGTSRQLWDMSADRIRATVSTDLKLLFSERKFKEL